MQLRADIPEKIETVLERVRDGLTRDGFVFVETDRSYTLHRQGSQVNRFLSGLSFWARKQLSDPYPATHSIEIEGELILADSVSVRADLFEYHDRRKHALGGSRALNSIIDAFGELLFLQ